MSPEDPNSQNYFTSASGFEFMVNTFKFHCVTVKVGKPNMWSRTHAREREEAGSHWCLLPILPVVMSGM